MGIKSTQYITRQEAIDRITVVNLWASRKNYREIEQMCFEMECNLQEFVDEYIPVDTTNLEVWTDDMLADKMGEPFIRRSMFDNYLIREAV